MVSKKRGILKKLRFERTKGIHFSKLTLLDLIWPEFFCTIHDTFFNFGALIFFDPIPLITDEQDRLPRNANAHLLSLVEITLGHVERNPLESFSELKERKMKWNWFLVWSVSKISKKNKNKKMFVILKEENWRAKGNERSRWWHPGCCQSSKAKRLHLPNTLRPRYSCFDFLRDQGNLPAQHPPWRKKQTEKKKDLECDSMQRDQTRKTLRRGDGQ